jgi:hypothetical protein
MPVSQNALVSNVIFICFTPVKSVVFYPHGECLIGIIGEDGISAKNKTTLF